MDTMDDFSRAVLKRAYDALKAALLDEDLPTAYMSRRMKDAIEREELTVWPSATKADELTVRWSFLTDALEDSIEGDNILLSDFLWHWPDCKVGQAELVAALERSLNKMKARFELEFGESHTSVLTAYEKSQAERSEGKPEGSN